MDSEAFRSTCLGERKPTVRILIVDDDVVDRELCRRCLKGTQSFVSQIFEASTAREAESLCRSESFDCLLVDNLLTDSSGLLFAKQLAAASGVHAPPVILMTGHGSEQLVVDAMHAGCADYIIKDGLTTASLNRAIENAVEKAVLRRAVESRSHSLERSNEQLRQRTEEIQRFYHSVSHEIKTPLTAAREFVALTLDGIGGPISSSQREFLEHALDSCDDIARHFDDLIDTTRLDTGKLRIRIAPAALSTAVARAVAASAQMARARHIELTASVPEGLPSVMMDAGRIVQVIANLVHNAVKFSEAGGRVTVTVTAPCPDQIELRVADQGCGIAAEHLPKIFQRLYQVNGGGEGSAEAGLGLGLFIAREIVRLHGGDLFASSEIGRGSTFWFRLPVANKRLPQSPKAEVCS
jgi:signal transduction histidine kinase